MQFKYTNISGACILSGSVFSGVGAGTECQAMNRTWLEPGRIQQCLHFVNDVMGSPGVSAVCFCAAVCNLGCAKMKLQAAGSRMLYACCQQ